MVVSLRHRKLLISIQVQLIYSFGQSFQDNLVQDVGKLKNDTDLFNPNLLLSLPTLLHMGHTIAVLNYRR